MFSNDGCVVDRQHGSGITLTYTVREGLLHFAKHSYSPLYNLMSILPFAPCLRRCPSHGVRTVSGLCHAPFSSHRKDCAYTPTHMTNLIQSIPYNEYLQALRELEVLEARNMFCPGLVDTLLSYSHPQYVLQSQPKIVEYWTDLFDVIPESGYIKPSITSTVLQTLIGALPKVNPQEQIITLLNSNIASMSELARLKWDALSIFHLLYRTHTVSSIGIPAEHNLSPQVLNAQNPFLASLLTESPINILDDTLSSFKYALNHYYDGLDVANTLIRPQYDHPFDSEEYKITHQHIVQYVESYPPKLKEKLIRLLFSNDLNVISRQVSTQMFAVKLQNIKIHNVRYKLAPPIFYQQFCIVINRLPKAKHLKLLNRLYPYTTDTDKRHMTVHFADIVHNYLQVASKKVTGAPTITKAMSHINWLLRHLSIGQNNIMATSFALASLSDNEHILPITNMLKSGILLLPPSLLVGALKAISTAVRRTALWWDSTTLTPQQQAASCYWEMAFGRSRMRSDWIAEVKNRTIATQHINFPNLLAGHPSWLKDDPVFLKEDENFYKNLHKHLLDLAKKLLPVTPVAEGFKDFFGRRSEWIANGAAAGAFVVLKGKKHRVAKRALAEQITAEQAYHWLDQVPAEIATASEKFENGKARAIYAVDFKHYVINTYATNGFEERLHLIPGFEKGASGLSLYHLERKRQLITTDSTNHCTMLDFADFNRHHTPRAQASIFSAFANIAQARNYHPDFVKANKWVASSKYNMKARFPGSSHLHPIKQGMFSGTRSTDLINTLLNYAYYLTARDFVSDNYSILPIDLYNVHQGDDIWLSNKSKVWAAALYYCMNNMGFIFQGSKQMFGSGRGEYLRVLYIDGLALGYLARAIVNFILRPIQNDILDDAREWAQSTSDSIRVMMRRGLGIAVAHAAYLSSVGFWAVVRSHHMDNKPTRIPWLAIMLPSDSGGLGALPPSHFPNIATSITPLPSRPSFDPHHVEQIHTLPSQMSDDWVAHVSAKYPQAWRSSAVKSQLLQSNYPDIMRIVGGRSVNVRDKAAIAKYRDSLPAHICNADYFSTLKTHFTYCDNSNFTLFLRNQLFEQYVATAPKHTLVRSQQDIMPERDVTTELSLTNNWLSDKGDASLACNLLARAIGRSPFKSLAMAATAWGFSRVGALKKLIADYNDSSMVETPDFQLLTRIADDSNSFALDFLEKGALDSYFSATCFVSPNLWNWYMQQARTWALYLSAHLQLSVMQESSLNFFNNLVLFHCSSIFQHTSISSLNLY